MFSCFSLFSFFVFLDLMPFFLALARWSFAGCQVLWLPNSCVSRLPKQLLDQLLLVSRRRQRTISNHEKDRQRTSNPIHNHREFENRFGFRFSFLLAL